MVIAPRFVGAANASVSETPGGGQDVGDESHSARFFQGKRASVWPVFKVAK